MISLVLTVAFVTQTGHRAAPPAPTTGEMYQRQIERRKGKAYANARARYLEEQRTTAAALYYQKHILPQQQRAAVEAAHAQASLMSADALQGIAGAAQFEAQTDRQRLMLQRQEAGYPTPGVNPYTGAPLYGRTSGPRVAFPSDLIP